MRYKDDLYRDNIFQDSKTRGKTVTASQEGSHNRGDLRYIKNGEEGNCIADIYEETSKHAKSDEQVGEYELIPSACARRVCCSFGERIKRSKMVSARAEAHSFPVTGNLPYENVNGGSSLLSRYTLRSHSGIA
jgi:hypothetical protein